MKHLFCLFLLLSTPLWAKTARKPIPATPSPVVAQEPAIPMARQRTVAEDEQLKAWIIDIQTTAQDQMKRADAAEAEAKASRDQSAIAESKAGEAQKQLADIQAKYNGVEDERNKAIEREAAQKARADKAEKESARRGNVIGILGGVGLALLFSHLLFLVPLPYKAIGVFALPAIGGLIGYFAARILI